MRHRIRGLACLCTAAAAVACGKSDAERAADSAAGATAAAMAPAPAPAASLADAAGTWNVRSVPESGDTTPTTYVLTATADSAWKIAFPGGLVVPVHAMVAGDSIITHAGPFASQRRRGVQVTTETVLRRVGDRLVGTSVAHYKTTRPDSVLRLRVEGTRAP